MPADSLLKIRDSLREFAAERDWEQFHSPRNLAAALVVEVAELLEHFQWLTDDQSRRLPEDVLDEARLEMADILLYLVRLADQLGVDLIRAARDKIAINTQKYPVDKARGRSAKYNKL